jgi:hypothetical protein
MTTGMKNVEKAFNKGGGAGTHVPGHISEKESEPTSPVGYRFSTLNDLVIVIQEDKSSSTTGVGTQVHEEKFANQLPKVSELFLLW